MSQTPSPILPPAMLGILGGGQLGRMFTIAAKTMGYKVTVLDPDPQAPAAAFADRHLCAPFNDADALAIMSECAAVTTEFENVNAQAMIDLATHTRVSPSGECVAIAQNRILEKKWIRQAGLATAPYAVIETSAALTQSFSAYLPGIMKTATMGYDGKGQIRVSTPAEVAAAFAELGNVACILERMLPLKSEVSAIVARLNDQQISCFAPAENQHKDGILDVCIVPARLPETLQTQAQNMAKRLANELDYVGVLAVEFFVLEDQTLIVNEMAPRPHNSGHYTLTACLADQFQQQVRTLCGLNPAKPDLLTPCVMVNLLGNEWPSTGGEPNWAPLQQSSNAHLYLYGKEAARPGRKMGHYTVLGQDTEALLAQALALQNTLTQPL
ncbi:MAG: 5-(carboxyamino)imidazole ribonucleotide synthase [Neisseriaceae bacterium]|nr:5-(carboxyamino)imidazole ribonucleotide synthase [Neisseriaceae bacterium]MBP6861830.1 5-(carboxyamino)imidazole ribonucleotide synthase [Neisseriaceae bacterium]